MNTMEEMQTALIGAAAVNAIMMLMVFFAMRKAERARNLTEDLWSIVDDLRMKHKDLDEVVKRAAVPNANKRVENLEARLGTLETTVNGSQMRSASDAARDSEVSSHTRRLCVLEDNFQEFESAFNIKVKEHENAMVVVEKARDEISRHGRLLMGIKAAFDEPVAKACKIPDLTEAEINHVYEVHTSIQNGLGGVTH